MADKEINDLTDGGAAASGDLAHVVRSGNSRKVALGNAAGKDTGTASGTVAAGDDARITGAAAAAMLMTPVNLALAALVASNELTIAIKGVDGNDPSASNPVYIPFRSATLATGTPVVRTLTAALSITVPNTALMGFASGVAGRVWVVAFDDAGTVRIGVINCREGTDAAGYAIYPLEAFGIASSTTVGTGSDAARTFYSDTGVTGKAYTVLGYVDLTQATAGTWATGPTAVQVYGPGVKLPGTRVQVANAATGGYLSCPTTIPWDDSVPQQSTEGTLVLSKAIVPQASANLLVGRTVINAGTPASAENVVAAVFRDSIANAIGANVATTFSANTQVTVPVDFAVLAGSTASTTFKSHLGGGTTTVNLNGVASARKLGGAMASTLVVEEIAA